MRLQCEQFRADGSCYGRSVSDLTPLSLADALTDYVTAFGLRELILVDGDGERLVYTLQSPEEEPCPGSAS